MYSVNGFALDRPDLGWRVLRRSQVLLGITKELSSISIPGKHGVLKGVPAFKGSQTVTFVIRAPGTQTEAIYSVFEKNGGHGLLELTDDGTRAAEFEVASIIPEGLTAEDDLVDVSVTLRVPTANWRGTSVSEYAPTVAGSVTNADVFPDISADIQDALLFVGGNFGNMEIQDVTSGSWLKTVKAWPNVASTGILINTATGQAFRATTASPWVPGADMSEYIDVSGGGGFRISPTWVSDPSARIGKLKLTVTNSSGVTFKVRGLNAYALRDGGI